MNYESDLQDSPKMHFAVELLTAIAVFAVIVIAIYRAFSVPGTDIQISLLLVTGCATIGMVKADLLALMSEKHRMNFIHMRHIFEMLMRLSVAALLLSAFLQGLQFLVGLTS